MVSLIRPSVLALAGALLCSAGALAGAPAADVTVAMSMSTTVSANDMTLLVSKTQRYFDAVLSDGKAFYALLTPDYVGVDASGQEYSAGAVFGSVQALKLELSGIVKSVRVLDAHQDAAGFDEIALVRGTADTIDAAGAHAISAAWVHKIYFVRDPSGELLIARDVCTQRV